MSGAVVLSFLVQVHYRTKAGTSSASITVEAPDVVKAFDKAKDRIRLRHGVLRVDGARLLGRPLVIRGNSEEDS